MSLLEKIAPKPKKKYTCMTMMTRKSSEESKQKFKQVNKWLKDHDIPMVLNSLQDGTTIWYILTEEQLWELYSHLDESDQAIVI